jgi:hypothetical protein
MLALVGMTCLGARDVTTGGSSSAFKVHPQVFSMIQCWLSDTDSPVVTEVSLDAVEKNRNQFSKDEDKEEGGWTVCREEDAKGFNRYRVIEASGNRYKVEYQENGGGTLTTTSIMEFSVLERKIRKDGKPTATCVLRVDAYSTKQSS